MSAGAEPVGHVRLGYARASIVRQPLDAQLDSIAEAGVMRVFSEKISTRATMRPELEAAVKLAGEIRSSGVAVTPVVHEHKRLGRGIELAILAEELKASDVGLEFLPGELKGSHDPSGIVFTVLAAMSGMEREYIRDRTLEGHESAASVARPSAARASPTRHATRPARPRIPRNRPQPVCPGTSRAAPHDRLPGTHLPALEVPSTLSLLRRAGRCDRIVDVPGLGPRWHDSCRNCMIAGFKLERP